MRMRLETLEHYRRVASCLFVALYLADGVTTLLAAAHGGQESNPGVRLLLRWSPLAFIGVKLITTPLVLWFFSATLAVWPRRAISVSLLLLAALAVVVAHNLAYLG